METTFRANSVYSCTFALIIDKRHECSKDGKYPIVVRFTINRQRWYWKIDKQTETDFDTICNLTIKKKAHKLFSTFKHYDDIMSMCKDAIEEIGEANLTLDQIKKILCGESTTKQNESFVSIWKEIISKLTEEGRFTTAYIYQRALNNMTDIFCKGDRTQEPIKHFQLDKGIIEKWIKGMDNGITINKKTIGKVSETTKGIYLRHFRAVWNECVSRGHLANVEYPFSNKSEKKISIPKGKGRKERYLSVEKMTQLYKIFIKGKYPDNWKKSTKKNVHYSLGLFLVQYLGNGMNLADVAQLEYNDFYFSTGCKCFRFFRQKTKNNSEDNSEVIVPIIEPLKKVIDELHKLNDKRTIYANAPEKNTLVFPLILKGETDPEKISKRLNQENTNIQDRVTKLVRDVLNWEGIEPSGTWCRHSFATNLMHQGVDKQYISDSMGHSTNKDITSRYIATYPISRQMEINNKLLNLTTKKVDVNTLIDNLTDEQKNELLKKLLHSK